MRFCLPVLMLLATVAHADETDDAMRRSLAPMIEHTFRSQVFEGLQKPDPCSPDGPYPEGHCSTVVGEYALRNAVDYTHVIAIGRFAGSSLRKVRNAILVGDCTTAPEDSDGFVNIGNKWCWWRQTGAQAACPLPEPGCRHIS